ncbi:SCO family protein [Magnetococcales bacterium HHB-1]
MIHSQEKFLRQRGSFASRFLIWLVFLLIVVGILHYASTEFQERAAAQWPPPGLKNIILDHVQPITAFPAMKDHYGEDFDLKRLKGKWSLIFFGYMHCPDVCPATLGKVAEIYKLLEKQAPDRLKQMQTLFITVDPKRDSEEKLKSFVSYFNPSFLGVYGDAKATARVASTFGVFYRKEAQKDSENYAVNHSTSLFLLNPKAEVVALLHPDLQDAKKLTSQLIAIQSHEVWRPH